MPAVKPPTIQPGTSVSMCPPPQAPSSPLSLYFKCTRSLVQKQTFPRLRADRPREAPKPAPQRKGWVTGASPAPPSVAPSLVGAEWASVLLSSFFFAADPGGPALGPSQQGNPGSRAPSADRKDVPGVSEAWSEAGRVAGGRRGRCPLTHGGSCRLVFPQGPGQAAPAGQQASQCRQDPAGPAPGIPSPAAPQTARRVLPTGRYLPDQLRPQPHPRLGQTEEETVTKQWPG